MAENLSGNPPNYSAPLHQFEGSLDGENMKIGIVCAKFNEQITKALLMGAIEGLIEHNVDENNIATYWVPGAFEVPLIVDKQFEKYDAMIAIACVIRGDTPHFDYVCQSITDGITNAINTHKKPGIFCVLTTNNEREARERAKPNSPNNKGYEAALGAIEMVNLINEQ